MLDKHKTHVINKDSVETNAWEKQMYCRNKLVGEVIILENQTHGANKCAEEMRKVGEKNKCEKHKKKNILTRLNTACETNMQNK